MQEFSETKWIEGYDKQDVNSFLLEFQAHHEEWTKSDVMNVKFAPVRLKAGYSMDEVDAHLDKLAASLPD